MEFSVFGKNFLRIWKTKTNMLNQFFFIQKHIITRVIPTRLHTNYALCIHVDNYLSKMFNTVVSILSDFGTSIHTLPAEHPNPKT